MKFGKNVTYPGRLINNLAPGKMDGARAETDRFPARWPAGPDFDVATRWKIPKSDADFGETFASGAVADAT
jgi:ABC-type transporter lipoprotein component MlaA